MAAKIVDSQLASELRVALMRLARRLRAERPNNDVTLSQISVLGVLERHGPANLAELSARERVQPPSMRRTTAALEERGLITRGCDPADRRHVVFELSSAGQDLLREDRRRREAWLAEQLASLTEQERAVLRAVAPLLDRLARS